MEERGEQFTDDRPPQLCRVPLHRGIEEEEEEGERWKVEEAGKTLTQGADPG